MDHRRSLSVIEHCRAVRADYKSQSVSTLRPTISLRKILEAFPKSPIKPDEKIVRKTVRLISRQERQARRRAKKLRRIRINLEIPPIIDTQRPQRFVPQRLPLDEAQNDDIEIMYRSIESIDEVFEPRFVSSRLYTQPYVLTKTTSIQTSIAQEHADEEELFHSQLIKRQKLKRHNVFYRHTYTKCRESIVKDFYYGLKKSGYQDPIDKNLNMYNAIVAYCYSKWKRARYWTPNDLDLILSNGRRFRELAENRPQLPQYCHIVDDCGRLSKKFYFYLSYRPKICGFILTKNRRIYNLTKGLQIYFANTKKLRYCLLQINNFYNFLIWKTRYFYYYFDTTTLENYAILANFHTLKAIITVLLKNKQIYCDNSVDKETKFQIFPMKIVQILDSDIDYDDNAGYRLIDPNKAVILGLYDLNHPTFGITRNRQALLIVTMALIYAKIIQTNCWTRDTINQIVIYANHLLLFLKKFEITFDNIPDKLPVGSYLVEISIRANFMVIESDPDKLGVEIAKFFHNNNSGIIEITTNRGSFLLAIWRQHDFFYLFDPYLCDSEGYRIGVKNGSGACCTITPTISVIVDLIQTNFQFNDNYRLYTFNLKQIIKQLKTEKTIEQELLELDRIPPMRLKERSCVDLDDENFFGRFQLEPFEEIPPRIDYDIDFDIGEDADFVEFHEQTPPPSPPVYVCKSTEIDHDIVGDKKIELPESKSFTRPRVWMIQNTKTLADFYPEQTQIDYLLPFIYLIGALFAKSYSLNNWTSTIIDNILKYGVELFKLFNIRYDQLDNFLIKSIKIERDSYQIRVNYLTECKVDFNVLKQILRNYLKEFNCFILITPSYCCMIDIDQQYYLFDTINNNDYCLYCYDTIDTLIMKIVSNKNRCQYLKKLQPYYNCVISACKVDLIADRAIDRRRRQEIEQIEGDICLNFYICLCASLLLLTTIDLLTINTINNPRNTNEIVKKGKLLYAHDDERNIYTKKLIKNLPINNYYFDLIVKLIVFKKMPNFNDNFDLLTRNHQYLILQIGSNFYSIFIDKQSNLYYLFDPIRLTSSDNPSKWLKFDNYGQFGNYLLDNNDNWAVNRQIDKNAYRFYQFDITSFNRKDN